LHTAAATAAATTSTTTIRKQDYCKRKNLLLPEQIFVEIAMFSHELHGRRVTVNTAL